MAKWSGWFKDDNGDKVNAKNESHSDGSVSQHYLRSKDGDRSNHSHTVVHHKTSGRTTAHHNPAKKSRS